MCRCAPVICALALLCAPSPGSAFVSPVGRGRGAISRVDVFSRGDVHPPAAFDGRVRPIGTPVPRKRRTRVAATEGEDEPESEEETAAADAEDTELQTPPTNRDVEEKSEPSATDKASSALFYLFSYTIQFLGVFFTLGLVLNLLGFGYTFSFDKGLEIDKIQNIRNEVQFEREIEREERMERRENGGASYIIAPNFPENNAVGVGEE